MRIADAAEAVQVVYLPKTAQEVVYVLQSERAGYLKAVPPEAHPEYPGMALRIGVTLTVKGHQYAPTARRTMKHQHSIQWSPAYKVGKSVAFATACQKGHTGFIRSTTDRLDWGYDCTSFMAGWREGLREFSKA